MLSFYKRYSRTAFDIGLIVLTVLLILWLWSLFYRIAAPIVLSFFVFLIIEPLAKFLNRRGLKKSIASAISILLFVTLILGALLGAGAIFFNQVSNLAEKVPHYAAQLQKEIVNGTVYLEDNLPPEVIDQVKEYASTITQRVSGFIQWALTMLLGTLSSFSSFLFKFFIAIILAYFLSVEIEFWKNLAAKKTPSTFKKAFYFLKENVLLGILSYVKAQLKLVSITFVVILTALLVLRVNNAFAISLMAAVFDILPLLGISTFFIPWIIYLFIVGQIQFAIVLTVVLIIVLLMRQILEPKFTGDSLGVSAFTTLAFMVVSLSLFGVAGLILSPVLIILLKALYDQGYLKRWIHLPEEEFEQDDKDNGSAGIAAETAAVEEQSGRQADDRA
ncbi:AI-2E family transporter [Xylanibacillus composti]|uniref:Sporulation integral membrane protein YtvI n=1 Tax=Xylanibacillus composti TaxID=1572762 RepID=A0A8J4H4T3_9BACL|nr:AI-2E family transporter [Xylanibacillus composti]MDT9723675.1 AI-2E family transporter [Xylanibacillus composti]GIQ71012.1 sporulation integral membrane protein YtvI [Xylanibacillus composti]